MIRNSIIYRRIWYIKRRNAKRLYVYARLLSIVIILSVIAFYAKNYSVPYINSCFEQQLKTIVNSETNKALEELPQVRWDTGTKYDSSQQTILSNTDYTRLNELSLSISERLNEKLKIISEDGIFVYTGAFLGDTRLSELGPGIKLRYRLLKDAESEFKFRVDSLESKKTENKLNLYIKLKVGVTILFEERETEIKVWVPVSG